MNGSALNSDYRPTLWPGVVIEEPLVMDLEVVRTDAPWIYLAQRRDSHGAPASTRLPENALEQLIARADVTDFESMVELAIALKGDVVPINRARWRDVTDSHVGSRPPKMHAKYGQEVRTWSKAVGWGTPSDLDLFWADESTNMHRVHAAEIAGRAWALQRALRGIGGLISVSASPFGHADFPTQAQSMEAKQLAAVFARNLQVFTPQITLSPAWTTDGAPEVDFRRALIPTAFEVAVLQLYNALARGDDPRICPACNNVFTSQVGRSLQDGRRTHRRADAIYCTPRCQKMIEQRRRRARVRQETAMAKGREAKAPAKRGVTKK